MFTVIFMSFKRIYLEITNICNLNCSFCSPLKREKRSMTLSEIENILSSPYLKGAHIYPHIKGEPLLHPDFKEISELFKKYEYPLNITTNGVFIKKHEEILINNARQVNISVHALLDSQIKNEEEYLEDIISFGKKASEKGYPNVSYRLWLEDKCEDFSKESYNIISKLAQAFNVEIPRKISKGRNALKLSENIYISLMNKFEWPDITKKEERKFGNCLGGKDMIGILADGTVVPCCLDADGVINLGNIFNEDLKDILNGERFKNLTKGFSGSNISESLCKKCTFYDSRKNR